MEKNVPLLETTKKIVLGSLLGDGSLNVHKGYRNARFSFRHSMVQKDYFLWKVSMLPDISSSKNIFIQENDGGYSKNKKMRFQSRALESLTELYLLTRKRGRFHIRRKWLNQMSALSLAIWWFDDGSIISNGRKGVFCTDGFEKKQVERLSQYLKIVWGVNTSVAPVGAKRDGRKDHYHRVWIRGAQELQKFLRIILPYTEVEKMLPKVILLYKNEQLQQRWISEIAGSTKFSIKTIERYVKIKKSKWKAYQKKI